MIRTITFELKDRKAPNDPSYLISAVKALRATVPGLMLKDAKEACDVGVFKVEAVWCNACADVLRPHCLWVKLDENVNSFDEAWHRLAGVILRLVSRGLNRAAVALEKVERNL